MTDAIIKIVVIGPNNSGKTSLLSQYLYNNFEGAYIPSKNCSVHLLDLHQKEKKYFPLNQETIEAATHEIAQKSLFSFRKIPPLSFSVQFWDIPISFLIPKTASSLHLLADAHGCIITVDSTSKDNGILRVGQFANLLNEAWGNVSENPVSVFLTKCNMYSRVNKKRELLSFTQKLNFSYAELSLIHADLVVEKIHELIDRILDTEIQRIQSNSCKVNWKFCTVNNNNNDNNQNKNNKNNNNNNNNKNNNNNNYLNDEIIGSTQSISDMGNSREKIHRLSSSLAFAHVESTVIYDSSSYVDNLNNISFSATEIENDDDDLFFDDDEDDELLDISQEEEIDLREKSFDLDSDNKQSTIINTFTSLSTFYEKLQSDIENILLKNSLSKAEISKYKSLLESSQIEYDQIKMWLEKYKVSSEESSGESASSSSLNSHNQLTNQIFARFIMKKEKIQSYLQSLALAEELADAGENLPDFGAIHSRHFSPLSERNSISSSSPIIL